MILLGLNGKKRSGKNSVARILSEVCAQRGVSVVERGFADLLKLSCARLFRPDISLGDAVEWAERLKDGRRVEVYGPDCRAEERASGREVLQRFGTEGHRDVFGESFWVDALLPLGAEGGDLSRFGDADVGVVTDVRFENEARRILLCQGRVVRVLRPGLDERDAHASEAPLPAELVDYTLDNSGTLGDLRAHVEVLVAHLGL